VDRNAELFLNPQVVEQPDRWDPAMILRGLGGGFFDPFWNRGFSLPEHSVEGRSADQMGLRQPA